MTVADAVRRSTSPRISVGALSTDSSPTVGSPEPGDGGGSGDRHGDEVPAQSELFDPETTVRVVLTQNVVPILATAGSYLVFALVGPI